jgi:hypothetical protein
VHDPQRRPEVTLTRSSASAVVATMSDAESDQAAAAPSRRGLLLALAVVGVLLLALTAPDRSASAPAASVDAQLVLRPDSLSVTQGGVLVVPLELHNGGAELQVRSANAYVEPVTSDPVVQAPATVRAEASRGFVVLLEPDCRLLAPGSPLRFRATVVLRVAVGSSMRDLAVDVAAVPAVRETVAGLCRV